MAADSQIIEVAKPYFAHGNILPKRANCGGAEVYDVEGLLDVQFPRPAMGIRAAVVIDAIGQVRIFLHLEDNHSRAHGVRSAGGDEKRVSSTRRVGFK